MQARRPETLARQRGKPRRPVGPAGRGIGAGRSPAPGPERQRSVRPRGLWIRIAAVAAVAMVAIVVAVVVAIVAAGRGGGDEISQRTAELEAQESIRQAEQVTDLTEIAIAVHGRLLPVMDGLHGVLPADGAVAAAPSDDDLAEWRQAVAAARVAFGESPSASTEVNTVRSGLVLAVDLLNSALAAYESALTVGGPEGERLESLAADLRRHAVDAWSVAAIQLDLVNIDAGHGHVHIYLPIRPGEEMADPHGHG